MGPARCSGPTSTRRAGGGAAPGSSTSSRGASAGPRPAAGGGAEPPAAVGRARGADGRADDPDPGPGADDLAVPVRIAPSGRGATRVRILLDREHRGPV